MDKKDVLIDTVPPILLVQEECVKNRIASIGNSGHLVHHHRHDETYKQDQQQSAFPMRLVLSMLLSC